MVLKQELGSYKYSDVSNINNYSGQSYVVSGCGVTENSPADMNVVVASGVVVLGGTKVTVAGGNVLLTTASSGKYKHAIIRVDSSGTLSAVYGTEDVTDGVPPSGALNVPDYDPDNYVALARINIGNVSTITNSDIYDLRKISPILYNTDLIKIMSRACIDLDNSDISDYNLQSGTDTFTKEIHIYDDFTVASGTTLNLADKPTFIIVKGNLDISGQVNIGDYDGSVVYSYAGSDGSDGTNTETGGAGGSAQTKLSSTPDMTELLRNLFNAEFSGNFANGLGGNGGIGTGGVVEGFAGLPKNQVFFIVLGDASISGTISGVGNTGIAGQAAHPTIGNGAGGGGAGGSGANIIIECYGALDTSSGTIDVSGGTGGAGGAGGDKKGGGGGGAGGSAGLIALLYKDSITEVGATYTITGGAGGAGGILGGGGSTGNTGGGGGSAGSWDDGTTGGDGSTTLAGNSGTAGNTGKLVKIQIV